MSRSDDLVPANQASVLASDASVQIVQCAAHPMHSSQHLASTFASATSGRG